MKRAFYLALALLLAIALTACQSGGGAQTSQQTTQQLSNETTTSAPQATTQESTAPRVIRIAHSAPSRETNQKDWQDCIAAMIADINAEDRGYKIEYTVFNYQFDINLQIEQIEAAMVQGYDILFAAPTDTAGAAPIIKQARESGMFVVDFGNVWADIVDLVFEISNEELYEKLKFEYVNEMLADNPDLHLNTAVLYGIMSQTQTLIRGDRMIEYAEQNPDRVSILVSGTANWNTEEGMKITEDWLQAYPDINYISSSNTEMAIGCVQALKAAGRLDDVMVSSFDLTDEAIEMLQAGELTFCVGPDNFDAAVELMDIVLKVYLGEVKLDSVVYQNNIGTICDPSNIDEYARYKKETREGLGVDVNVVVN